MFTKDQIDNYTKFLSSEGNDLNELISNSSLDPSKDFIGFNFDNLYLNGINLSKFNLQNATFRNCILVDSIFSGANLNKAIFQNSNIIYSNFDNAILDKTIFSNISTRKVQGLDKGFNKKLAQKMGKILLIEDEVETVKDNLEILFETFPGLSFEFAETCNDAKRKLKESEYIFAIIDAQIPDSKKQKPELSGAELAIDLIGGEIKPVFAELKHIVLTHHKSALSRKHNPILEADGNCIGIIEKDKDPKVFGEIVANSIFSFFANQYQPLTP